ncbi:hypothetical protein EJB05_03201, partial [Eragrostis curvula]
MTPPGACVQLDSTPMASIGRHLARFDAVAAMLEVLGGEQRARVGAGAVVASQARERVGIASDGVAHAQVQRAAGLPAADLHDEAAVVAGRDRPGGRRVTEDPAPVAVDEPDEQGLADFRTPVHPAILLHKSIVTWCRLVLHLRMIDGDREYAEFMHLPIGLQTLITSKGVVADSGGDSTCSF